MKNFKTKNSIGFFTLVVLLMMLGCKDKAVEKEVIVMPGTTTETTTKESTKIIEKELLTILAIIGIVKNL